MNETITIKATDKHVGLSLDDLASFVGRCNNGFRDRGLELGVLKGRVAIGGRLLELSAELVPAKDDE